MPSKASRPAAEENDRLARFVRRGGEQEKEGEQTKGKEMKLKFPPVKNVFEISNRHLSKYVT